MKVAIRDDDTSYFTKPKDLQRAYDFLNEDDCVSLSVVPYTVPVHRDTQSSSFKKSYALCK